MLLSLSPAKALAPYVAGYWFVEDIVGAYRGRPIATSPQPGAVLSVNFGRPNVMVGGPAVPRTSLLGMQTVGRHWTSDVDTSFVMAMLTPVGVSRLLPGARGSVDQLLELGAILGDRVAGELERDTAARSSPESVGRALDTWLLARLDGGRTSIDEQRLGEACRRLAAGHRVERVADIIGVSRRHLARSFQAQLGIGPKALSDLYRFQASLRAVQADIGDPLAGYSDQAHQIRDWRRRVGRTPGSYGAPRMSPMASYFQPPAREAPAFYL